MGLLKLSEGKNFYDPREVILLFKDDITAFDGPSMTRFLEKEK